MAKKKKVEEPKKNKPPIKQKYIESPEKMWEYFCSFRAELKANPILIIEQRKGTTIIPKDFQKDLPSPIIELPTARLLTMEGFQNYLADNDIIQSIDHYLCNQDDKYKPYLSVCRRIRRVIRQDQIEGGMVGIYNPSITQRLNGLTEKTEITGKDGKDLPGLNVIFKTESD